MLEPKSAGRGGVVLAIVVLAIVCAVGFWQRDPEITWYPDNAEGRVVLVVKKSWFSKPKYLPLYWRKTWEYASGGEMAWCAWIDKKWVKVYPFGEDSAGTQWKPEWLLDSPWRGDVPPVWPAPPPRF